MVHPENITDRFRGRKVVVIGDLVADQYLSGTIARVSREAPVFILRHDETITVPGAAANAAANVASLGGTAIAVGVVGNDANGAALVEKMRSAGIDVQNVLSDEGLSTTTKMRIHAGQKHAVRQQVIRVDYENSIDLPVELRSRIISSLRAAAADADGIIVSDYDYGVADASVFAAAMQVAAERGIPIAVDSRAHILNFHGATTATPNQDEVETVLGKAFSDADCENLRDQLGLGSLLVTKGNKGMTLFEPGEPPCQIDVVGSLEPVDVTGAGDTVIAAYALGLAAGLSCAEAARIATHAGGVVVMKKGTAVASAAELEDSIRSVPPETAEGQTN